MNSTDKHSTQTFQIESSYLGCMDYQKAYNIQENLWHLAKTKNQYSIIGLQHLAVITLGRRAKNTEILTFSQSIPVVQSSRGGLATLHSEGQLVIYPIIDLRRVGLGVKDYVEELLSITKKTFSDFNVPTEVDAERIGLFTETGKIAFCGLEIRQGISLHGLSINIQNDLNLFDHIRSCGVEKMATDALKNYRGDVSPEQFYHVWFENFRSRPHFGMS